MYNPLAQDPEAGGYYDKSYGSAEFAEAQVRQGFIRKVFGLLAVQLAITVGVTAAFLYSPPVKNFVAANSWTLWLAIILSFALVIVLSCSEQARRQHPTNLIMLMAFTVCESVLVGAASATFDTNLVLLAGGITAGVVVGLTIFAFQTKVDLTASGGALLSLLLTLILASILQSFLHVPWMQLAISAGGALLFSVYLVFDIQLLIGGGSASLSPDEYVYGALSLYLDALNLFLYILRLLNDISQRQ